MALIYDKVSQSTQCLIDTQHQQSLKVTLSLHLILYTSFNCLFAYF